MKHIFHKTNNKMVLIQVVFDAGARAEGAKYSPGMAHMLEHMFFKGTENRHYLDLAKEIAYLGGHSNAFTSDEMVSYYIKVPFENFEKGAEILSDMMFHSTFPEEEFLKEKEVVLEECLSAKDDPTYDLNEAFSHNFFSGRLQTPIIGTEESIQGFTHKELLEFYKEFYTTESGILLITGDLDPEKVRATSEKFYGIETPFVRQTKPQECVYKPALEMDLYKDSLEQSHLIIAYPGLKVKESENIAADVLVEILGRGMDSRLFTEVREKNNLCYDIGLHSSSHLEIGSFFISSSTRKSNIEKMLELVKVEIDKIKTELITEEELQRAKNKIRTTFYETLDSSSYFAQDLLSRQFFELPSLEDMALKIDQVTREEVLELAKQVFDDQHKMTFILSEKD